MEKLKELYTRTFDKNPSKIDKIQQAGSNRQYFRFFSENESIIGVKNFDLKENNAFITLSKHFEGKEVNTPKIISVSDCKQYYFQSDLGNTDLFKELTSSDLNNFNDLDRIKSLYKKSISLLAKMQLQASKNLDYDFAYPDKVFDKKSMEYDLNYFKYYFVKASKIDFSEPELNKDIDKFTTYLDSAGIKNFMFRDFQARNIMIKNEQPYFIDYQGGRLGAIQYDIASLLFQAKAALSEELREELFEYYMSEVEKYISIDREKFTKDYYNFVLIRVLQTLGAYGFRGLIEKKAHFIQSIPYALKNLSFIYNNTKILNHYPYFKYVIELLLNVEDYKIPQTKDKSKLTIQVISFSYKKGIPIDLSGNGGGFVFDCRGIHNPGRYQPYKQLTGRDKEVIDFLQTQSNIKEFLEKAISICRHSIDNYIERNFSNLTVCFGCTGGQHRSVYSAENFAKTISQINGVEVELWHREQKIREML